MASMAVVVVELAVAVVVASLSSPTSTAQPSFFLHGHIAVVPIPQDPVKRNYPHLPMPLGQYYYYYYYYCYCFWQQLK